MTRLRGASLLSSLALAGLGACADDSSDRGTSGNDTNATGAETSATAGTDSAGTAGDDDDGTGSNSGTGASGTAGTGGTAGTAGTGSGDTGSTSAGDTTASTSNGDSTGTTSASGTGGTTAGGKVPCDTASATLEPIPPNIYLVLDKSGSMVKPENFWDHDGMPATPDQSRWAGLYDVVDFVIANFDMSINFGLVLFPGKNVTTGSQACDVPTTPVVPVGSMTGSMILSQVPPRNSMEGDGNVFGATPTRKGLDAAYADLKTKTGDNAPGVILVTDGAANCPGAQTGSSAWNAYDDGLLQVVSDAWTVDQIPTYVVGIDISMTQTDPNNNLDGEPNGIVPFDKMNELASAGGRPKPGGGDAFYDTSNGAELQSALQQIIDDSLSCIVDLNPVPAFPDFMEVEIGGNQMFEVTDCATENGWVWTNKPMQIELCGTACSDLKSVGTLDALYFCDPG